MQASWEQAAASPPDLRAITDAAINIITFQEYSRDSQPRFSTFPFFPHGRKQSGKAPS